MSDLDSLLAKMDALLERRPYAESAASDGRDAAVVDRDVLMSLRNAMQSERTRVENAGRIAKGREPGKWEMLVDDASAALSSGHRSMEAACWLLEAVTHAYGFAGFAAGARLIGGLVEHDWERLEPRPKGHPTDAEIARSLLEPLKRAATDRLPAILRETVLFEAATGHNCSYAIVEMSRSPTCQARRDSLMADRTKRPPPAPLATIDEKLTAPENRPWPELSREAQETQGDQLAATCRDLRAAIEAWKHLGNSLAGHDPNNAVVPITPIADLLTAILAPLAPLVKEPEAARHAGSASPEASGDVAAPKLSATMVIQDQAMMTREQALAILSDIAQFFQRTEPQSPISTALTEIVRRAKLSFPELMAEILPRKEERDGMLLRLGIRPDQPA